MLFSRSSCSETNLPGFHLYLHLLERLRHASSACTALAVGGGQNHSRGDAGNPSSLLIFSLAYGPPHPPPVTVRRRNTPLMGQKKRQERTTGLLAHSNTYTHIILRGGEQSRPFAPPRHTVPPQTHSHISTFSVFTIPFQNRKHIYPTERHTTKRRVLSVSSRWR